MLSVKDVCERIWAIERELSLFHRTFGGEPLWPLCRMKIYYRISQAAKVFSTPHSEKVSLRNVAGAVGNTLALPLTTPFKNKTRKRFLVFDHPRKIPVEGRYVDIYTQRLLERLPAESTEVFENWQQGVHLTEKDPQRTYLDDLAVGSAIAALKPFRFSKKEQRDIIEVEKRIEQAFGVSVPLVSFFAKELKHHRFCVKYFTKLLDARKPERIYLVVSYSHYKRGLIVAAKRLGIHIVEIQHGTFSPYHLGYNFPDLDTELECFPDTFYTFGDYWNNLAKMPIGSEHIKTWGFDHFNRQVETVRGETQDPHAILVISQGVIGTQLSKVVADLAPKLPDHRITVKLHPGEYALWRQDYPALVTASVLPNVEVVDQDTIGLYTRFARSRYQIGVFSTAIYEGLALGCRTFVVDLPGVEYMDYLVDREMVFKVKSADDIVAAIAMDKKPAPFDSEFIFARFSEVALLPEAKD